MLEDIRPLKKKYGELFGDECVSDRVLDDIQSRLGVLLPEDVREIASFYGGGLLGGTSHHAFAVSGPANNVVEETIRLRTAIKLPTKFVVLAEPANSLIVLDTCTVVNGPVVVRCARRNGLGRDCLTLSPDVWSSYREFFAYLIEEEEER